MLLVAGGFVTSFSLRQQNSISINLPHDLGGPHSIDCQTTTSCLIVGENYLAKGGFIGEIGLRGQTVGFEKLDGHIPNATALSCYAKNGCLVAFAENNSSRELAQFSPTTVSNSGVRFLSVPAQFQQVNAIYCRSNTSVCLVAGKAAGNYNFAFQLISIKTFSFIGAPAIMSLPDIGGVYDISCDQSQKCLAIMENFDGTEGIVYEFTLSLNKNPDLTKLTFTNVNTPPANLLLAVSCAESSCIIGGSDASSIHGLLITVNMNQPTFPYSILKLPKGQGPILAVGKAREVVVGGYPQFSNYGDVLELSHPS